MVYRLLYIILLVSLFELIESAKKLSGDKVLTLHPMKKNAIIVLLFFFSISGQSQDLDNFFAKSQLFFKGYVKDGMVSYASVKRRFSQVDHLMRLIEKTDLSSADDQTKKAFYINAYNIIVIYQITKNYPIAKPLDQDGFFDKIKSNVAGQMMTLNQLEIDRLLKVYKDPRIHFALACAAVSCPQLANYAFRPEKLDEELDKRSRLCLNSTSFVRVDRSKKRVELSKIFEWYKGDFEQVTSNQIEFVNKYRTNKIPTDFQIGYYEYNWKLNDLSSVIK